MLPTDSEIGETRRATRAALAISPGVLLTGVAGGIAFPILPLVGVQAGLPLAFIGAILAANRATRVLSSPLVGALTDRIGGRRTLLVGMAIQVAVMGLYTAGIITGHPGLYFLLGRLLHGPGSACVFVSSQALALHAGGEAHGGRAAGLVRGSIALGVPVGVVVGGVLSERLGNVATFEGAVVALVLAALAAAALVPDLRATLAVRPGLAAQLRLLASKRPLAIGALNFALSFSAQGMVLTTLALLVRERALSLAGLGEQGTSGVLLGLLIVPAGLAMPLAGRLGDRFSAHAAVAAVGLALLIPSLLAVALGRGTLALGAALVAMGFATAALSPSLLALIGDTVPAASRGLSAGLLQLCGDVGGTLGPLVGTALFTGSSELPYLATAVGLVGFLPVALWLARQDRVGRREPSPACHITPP